MAKVKIQITQKDGTKASYKKKETPKLTQERCKRCFSFLKDYEVIDADMCFSCRLHLKKI